MQTHCTWYWESRTICLIFSSCAGSLCFSGWLHSALGTWLTLWVTEFFINKGLAFSHNKALCWAMTPLNGSHVIRTKCQPDSFGEFYGFYGLTPAGIPGTKFSPVSSRERHLCDLRWNRHGWKGILMHLSSLAGIRI